MQTLTAQELAGGDNNTNPLWLDISTAPMDGTEIVGWFETNEVHAPHKSKPWITKFEMQQFKDGTGAKVGKPFGLWIAQGWSDKMSFAPTKWMPKP
jgi:hypothetical protein